MKIPRSQIIRIIGPSGSGISTLLRFLNRLWEPTRGTVFLDGLDISEIDVVSLRQKVAMLFQLPTLFQGTIANNVWYGPRLRGETLSNKQVYKLLSILGIRRLRWWWRWGFTAGANSPCYHAVIVRAFTPIWNEVVVAAADVGRQHDIIWRVNCTGCHLSLLFGGTSIILFIFII
ncbi:unnamed protein product [Linum tenue]|nr:unnamed protein product [Linum tenue]